MRTLTTKQLRTLTLSVLLILTAAVPALPTRADTASVTYERVSRELITPHCLSCHTTGRPSLNTYEKLRAQAPNALIEIEAGRMPRRRARPPQAAIDLLRSWIQSGYPRD